MERIYTCPNCGQTSIINGEEWELDYNCPIATCSNCNCEFLRENCKEIAMNKVSFDDRLPISLWAIGAFLFGVILLLSSFHFGSSVMIFRPKSLIFGVIAVLAGFAMAVSGIKNFKKKSEYLKGEKEKSQIRCANSEYTAKLEALGYKKK